MREILTIYGNDVHTVTTPVHECRFLKGIGICIDVKRSVTCIVYQF